MATPLPTPTQNPVPSTDIRDAVFAGAKMDEIVTSPGEKYVDRFGNEHYTIEGVRQNLIPLSRQYMTLAAAQADIANIPDGSATYVRSDDGSSLADEYINNGGTLEATGRKMPSQSGIATAINYVLSGIYPTDVSSSWEITQNFVIFSDGTTGTNSSWDGYFIPCKEGDQADYFGVINTSTAGDKTAWIIQCDDNKNYVKVLAETISTGVATEQGTVHGVAVQDGYIYIRVRNSSNPNWNINFLKKHLITTDDYLNGISQLNQGLWPESASSVWEITRQFVLFSGGLSGTYSDWDAYYIPCSKGDQAEYSGIIDLATAGTVTAWLIQCDTDKKYVSDLAVNVTTGDATRQGTVRGTAIQDGYIYVRVKNSGNAGWYINFMKKFLVASSDVGIAGGVAEYDVLKAIGDNGQAIDYTKNGNVYIFGTVMLYDGTVNSNAGNDWLAYYLPVSKGDKVTMSGIYGSATVGQQMAYFIQLDYDKNFVAPLDIYTSTGASDVQLTRSVVASQDGVMYVRVRRVLGGVEQAYSVTAFQRSYKLLQDLYALQNQVDDLINNGAVQTPVIGATLEQVPVRLDNRFNYNAAVYIQDNVVIAGNYTFVVATRGNRHPIIMRKENLTGVWTYFDLHYVTGNPLASPTEEDSHNVYSLGVTKDGYLIVSGNMHAKPCRAVISNTAYDITAWTAISYTTSEEVTYPRFVKYPDGITQAFWRQGLSAAGQYFSALFDDATRTFGPVFQIAATDLNANAYEQRLGVGRDGSLHFCFGLRVNANTADANRGLYYAKSMDKGQTWTNAAGTVNYPAPLTEANSEKIADIPIYSGYVNQNGGACDYDSHYHTCLWQTDENNHTQIAHIWFDGTVWHEELVSKFDFKVDTSRPLLTGTLSRPAIGCNKYGKTWIFYRTTEMGRDGEIRAIDVSEPGNPIEHIVTGFNMGTLELAVNTNTLMNDNQLLMLATRGAIGYADPMYSRYTDEPGYLLVAVMP
ncbi:TPA: BNR-4 repeat-containing protein [Klebsiella aerogenes]|nr:BNR-4 repeat-containing protein [Klebsiella aerogenes]